MKELLNKIAEEINLDERRVQLTKDLREIYTDIGEIFFKDHRNEIKPTPKYADLFKKAYPIYKEIEEIEKNKLADEGLKKCPSCGAYVTLESRFCNMCGLALMKKQEAVKAQEPAKTQEQNASTEQ